MQFLHFSIIQADFSDFLADELFICDLVWQISKPCHYRRHIRELFQLLRRANAVFEQNQCYFEQNLDAFTQEHVPDTEYCRPGQCSAEHAHEPFYHVQRWLHAVRFLQKINNWIFRKFLGKLMQMQVRSTENLEIPRKI